MTRDDWGTKETAAKLQAQWREEPCGRPYQTEEGELRCAKCGAGYTEIDGGWTHS